MYNLNKIGIGIVGLGCRGISLLQTLLSCEEAEIVAVCDIYQDRVDEAADKINKNCNKKPACYTDFEKLLQNKNVGAVVICSSWDEHIGMAIKSMRAGIITALEVGGAYDIEECWELVRAYEQTKTPIMMMENCCFDRYELLVTSMARAGVLGEIVHCSGAYSHDLREEILGGNINGHYRQINYKKRNCENYPTHELGPISKLLDINRGNRMVSLVSVASKGAGIRAFAASTKNPDKSINGDGFRQGDIVNTVISCANGETISLTLDTTLPTYYSRKLTVRATKALCEQQNNLIMIEDKDDMHEFFEAHKTIRKYLDSAEKFSEYLPKEWKNITQREIDLGHGGMDYIMMKKFLMYIKENQEFPIDVYDAASWASISALSAASVRRGGQVQDIPDFTKGKWLTRQRKDVIDFQ